MKILSISGAAPVQQPAQALDRARETAATQPEDARQKDTLPAEYIPSDRTPSGLYRYAQDGNGNPEIRYDGPGRPVAGKEPVQGEKPEEEECTMNTDRVDREIQTLKNKKQQLQQQIKAEEDEEKAKVLESKLARVEGELSRKDNDAYRRQNASIS